MATKSLAGRAMGILHFVNHRRFPLISHAVASQRLDVARDIIVQLLLLFLEISSVLFYSCRFSTLAKSVLAVLSSQIIHYFLSSFFSI